MKATEKKEAASQFKANIENIENELQVLAAHVRNKYEYRDVECDVIPDFKSGVVVTVRNDTGEVIDERPMTAEERQLKLGE